MLANKVRYPVAAVLILLIVSGALRFSALSDNPPGFFRDEADKGYTAFSLLHTASDTQARRWPVFAYSLGVYTTALYQYLLMPFIHFLGLGEFAVRLPSALCGTLTVLAVFVLGKRLFGFWSGLFAGFLLAFSPWHLVFSRWANQGIFLPLFLVCGVYCWQRARERGLWTVACAVFLSLALYSYEPAKVVVPGFLAVFVVSCLWEKDRKAALRVSILVALVAVLAIPMIGFHFTQAEMSNARFEAISIFSSDSSPVGVMGRLLRNFLLHLSPRFLFLQGDANLRHSVRSAGQLFGFEIILIVVALWRIFATKCKNGFLLIVWIVIAFVPASLTDEGIPHALRSIAAVPAFAFLSAYGANELRKLYFSSNRRNLIRAISIALGVIVPVSLGLFLTDFFLSYPVYSAPCWQYGWQQVIEESEKESDRYPRVIISGMTSHPEVFVYFYTRYPPLDVQTETSPERYFFLPFGSNASKYLSRFPKPAIFVGRAEELPELGSSCEVKYPDGRIAWVLRRID